MVRRYYNLPSLTALAVFEASARHMNFVQAGNELNVTRGAVSRQIKALEEELGVALFERDAKGVSLTTEGETLYAVLARGFSEAAATVAALRSGQGDSAVTLACTNAFATFWLMPQLGAFWRSHPDIELHHLISDRPQDFRRAEIDLRNEKISYKVREHSLQKIPAIFVLGRREADERTVTVRRFGTKAQQTLSFEDAIGQFAVEARSRGA